MNNSGIENTDETSHKISEIEGVIQKISEIIVDGNSHYFIKLNGSDKLFDVSVVDNISILNYAVGSTVKFNYTEGISYNKVDNVQ